MLLRRVDIQDWTVIFLFSLEGHEEEEVLRQLFYCKPPKSVANKVAENLEANRENEGFTYSNTEMRRSVVYIGPTNSGAEFLSSFVHELAHLVCDICITDRISLRGEEIAYLTGEIARRLSDVVCHFSCDNCSGA